MGAGWVAAALRGRAMARHGLGASGARASAAGSWDELLRGLSRSTYGSGLDPSSDRVEARHHCSAIAVWNLRVLAGWVPPGALEVLRALVGEFEVENIELHLHHLASGSAPRPLELGGLATAWPRVQECSTPDEVRAALRLSSWGDPGGADPVAVAVGLRIARARRVCRHVPGAASWARGAVALVVARERFVFDRELPAVTAQEVDRLIGRRWRTASTLAEFADAVGPEARWVFVAVQQPSDLWQAERAWWTRVEADATEMVDTPRPGSRAVVGAVATMLVDLHRVHAAVETAGRGPAAIEVFDAVA
jgi:hypothetical protein